MVDRAPLDGGNEGSEGESHATPSRGGAGRSATVWICTDVCDLLNFGKQFERATALAGSVLKCGSRTRSLVNVQGVPIMLEEIAATEAVSYMISLRGVLTEKYGGGSGAAPSDARTLEVEHDSTGLGYRSWKSVSDNAEPIEFTRWPL